jgi:putative NADPH-quinone reductase
LAPRRARRRCGWFGPPDPLLHPTLHDVDPHPDRVAVPKVPGRLSVKILYVYSHPLPESFHAGIRARALAALEEAGHDVDLLDLYAENFDPVLSEHARRHYHEIPENRIGLESHIERLTSADAIVMQFPTWCFGMPAMLKGYCERLLMPGVAFDISDPNRVKPTLANIRKIVGVVTYGRPWYMAKWMGDPPRKMMTRYLHWFTGLKASVDYLALYHQRRDRSATRRFHCARRAQAAGVVARRGFFTRRAPGPHETGARRR